MSKNILVISDIQAPFHHEDTLAFLAAVRDTFNCEEIVNIGDSLDFHGISFHGSDPDGYSAGHEYEQALEFLEDYFDLFPEGTEVFSNHNARPFRKAYAHGLPKKLLKDYREMMNAPDTWKFVPRYETQGIVFEHGERFGGKTPALSHAENNMKSTVTGHHHSAYGINYFANHDSLIWGMAVGCLVDRHSYAFAYGNKSRRKEVLGCGVIFNGLPVLVPMALDRQGRWNGKTIGSTSVYHNKLRK